MLKHVRAMAMVQPVRLPSFRRLFVGEHRGLRGPDALGSRIDQRGGKECAAVTVELVAVGPLAMGR